MKNFLFILFFFVATLGFRISAANCINGEWQGSNLLITCNFDEYKIDMLDTITSKSVHIDGFGTFLEAGRPNLPTKIETFIIPDGLTVGSVDVISSKKSINLKCCGSLGPTPESDIDSQQNENIYSELISDSGVWPAQVANILTTQIYRDQNIGSIQISPFQYDYEAGHLVFNYEM